MAEFSLSSLNKSEGGVARQCIGSFSCPQGCKEQFCAALLLLYVRADTAALSSGPIPPPREFGSRLDSGPKFHILLFDEPQPLAQHPVDTL